MKITVGHEKKNSFIEEMVIKTLTNTAQVYGVDKITRTRKRKGKKECINHELCRFNTNYVDVPQVM